jgi:hypothetical protein
VPGDAAEASGVDAICRVTELHPRKQGSLFGRRERGCRAVQASQGGRESGMRKKQLESTAGE